MRPPGATGATPDLSEFSDEPEASEDPVEPD